MYWEEKLSVLHRGPDILVLNYEYDLMWDTNY